ncbi:MAG: SAF domain-containing protein [Candidatus Obscuribacterales bacterium]|jgi:Flp pilus assembly protein CpaB
MATEPNDRPALAAFVLALSTAAAGIFFYLFYEQKQQEIAIKSARNESRDSRSPQVYCIKTVPKGTIITSDCLEIRLVPQDKLPPDGLSNPSGALGRETKYGLSVGEHVCGYMFGTSTKEMTIYKTYWPRFKELPPGNFYKGVRINRD